MEPFENSLFSHAGKEPDDLRGFFERTASTVSGFLGSLMNIAPDGLNVVMASVAGFEESYERFGRYRTDIFLPDTHESFIEETAARMMFADKGIITLSTHPDASLTDLDITRPLKSRTRKVFAWKLNGIHGFVPCKKTETRHLILSGTHPDPEDIRTPGQYRKTRFGYLNI